MRLRIAWRSVLRHRLSTAVLTAVCAAAAFVLFWSFGFCNHIRALARTIPRDSYGDLTFFIDFADRGRVAALLALPGVEQVVCEREITALFDSPERSALAAVVELTPDNRDRLRQYVQPVAGRLPARPDELLITDFKQQGVYRLGDRVFATVTTPGKIINAQQYTVVGIAKTSAFKALGYAFMVTQESMSGLLNAADAVNLAYVYLAPAYRTRAAPAALRERILGAFSAGGIGVRESWTLPDRQDKLPVRSI